MIRIELITLSGTKLARDVHEVRLPTPDGEIGVFTNHAPLVSVASPGAIIVKYAAGDPEQKWEYYATNGGVIEITSGRVRVLVDEADQAEEINESETERAFERAKTLRAEATDEVSLEQAQALIDRQAVRLQVANLRRRHRNQRP